MNLGNYSVPDETINGVCIDVGCNFGDFTNTHANHFSKIYFIEPQIQLFEQIKNRFENNNKIEGFNLAAWNVSNVDLEMVYHSNNDFGSVGVKTGEINHDWTNNVVNKVKSINLPDLLKKINHENIDYLKLDCETSEYKFLLKQDLSKIKYIGIELHHHMGIEKYNELLSWIKNTHDLIVGNDTYEVENNKEVLYKLR
jgi:FkbM family methyltransferase